MCVYTYFGGGRVDSCSTTTNYKSITDCTFFKFNSNFVVENQEKYKKKFGENSKNCTMQMFDWTPVIGHIHVQSIIVKLFNVKELSNYFQNSIGYSV